MIVAHLNGGLGNQLFQLAAALSNTSNDVLLASSIGLPKMTNGLPDIHLLKLPERVKFDSELPKRHFLVRLANFLLRSGLNPRRSSLQEILEFLLRKIFLLLSRIHFQCQIFPFVASDVGYVNLPKSRSNLLIGYFQSWRYLSVNNVRTELMKIYPVAPSKHFLTMESEISSLLPIVVHVRLGDYLSEEHFGVPSESFFLEALSKILSEKSKPIWIFTNDVVSLSDLFPNLVGVAAEIIGDTDLSSAEVLELMRHGSAFVIANSSFSWWSASLRYDEAAQVFSPQPWFRGMPEPQDLIPGNWNRLTVRTYL